MKKLNIASHSRVASEFWNRTQISWCADSSQLSWFCCTDDEWDLQVIVNLDPKFPPSVIPTANCLTPPPPERGRGQVSQAEAVSTAQVHCQQQGLSTGCWSPSCWGSCVSSHMLVAVTGATECQQHHGRNRLHGAASALWSGCLECLL